MKIMTNEIKAKIFSRYLGFSPLTVNTKKEIIYKKNKAK